MLLQACSLKSCIGIDEISNTITDSTSSTVNALDDAIRALETASGDWQKTLNDLTAKLTDDAQSTIRSEVSNLITRSIATGGVEFRCDADFVGDRVRQALVRIRAKLLGGEVGPVEPGLCQIVPLAVDRQLVPDRVNRIEFYGYDFDQAQDLRCYLERSVGGRLDVTNALDRPTHYAMTLRFGANGVQLDDSSSRIVMEWQGRPKSTIAVIQPMTPVCRSSIANLLENAKLTFVPPKVGSGDAEFSGHGPAVSARVSLLVDPGSITAHVEMQARETKSDWSTASGEMNQVMATADPGWRFERIVGPTETSISYVDSDVTSDEFDKGPGSPVAHFSFVGDTGGSEAGTRTQVVVTFNRVRVETVETANCVSAGAVRAIRDIGMVSDMRYGHLKLSVDKELLKLKTLAHP